MTLLVLGFLVSTGVVTASPAHACSCAGGTAEELMSRADLVVEAQVISLRVQERTGRDGPTTRVHGLHVHRAWRGTHEPTVSVRTASSPASCGVDLQAGERYLVLAQRLGGEWRVNLCGGSTLADGSHDMPKGVTVSDVEAALGSGWTPPAERAADRGDLAIAESDRPWPHTVAVVVVGGVGLLALGAVTVLVLRGPRRRS